MLHTEKLHKSESHRSRCHKQLHSIDKRVRRKHTGCILGSFQAIKRLTELKIWPSIFFVVFCPVANPPNNHASEEGWVCSFHRGYYTNLRPTIHLLCWVLPVCSLSAQPVTAGLQVKVSINIQHLLSYSSESSITFSIFPEHVPLHHILLAGSIYKTQHISRFWWLI